MNSLGACSHKNSYLAPILYGDSRDRGFGESEGAGRKGAPCLIDAERKRAGRKGVPCLIICAIYHKKLYNFTSQCYTIEKRATAHMGVDFMLVVKPPNPSKF